MSKRWNILEIVQRTAQRSVYRDYEGFASGDKILRIANNQWVEACCEEEPNSEMMCAVRDIGLNIISEMLNMDDWFASRRLAMQRAIAGYIFWTVHEVLTVPEWTKSGLKEKPDGSASFD